MGERLSGLAYELTEIPSVFDMGEELELAGMRLTWSLSRSPKSYPRPPTARNGRLSALYADGQRFRTLTITR